MPNEFRQMISRAVKELRERGERSLANDLRAVVFKLPKRRQGRDFPSQTELESRLREAMSNAAVDLLRSYGVTTEYIRSEFNVDQALRRSGMTEMFAKRAREIMEQEKTDEDEADDHAQTELPTHAVTEESSPQLAEKTGAGIGINWDSAPFDV
jgi:Fe-S oxidoreductase